MCLFIWEHSGVPERFPRERQQADGCTVALLSPFCLPVQSSETDGHQPALLGAGRPGSSPSWGTLHASEPHFPVPPAQPGSQPHCSSVLALNLSLALCLAEQHLAEAPLLRATSSLCYRYRGCSWRLGSAGGSFSVLSWYQYQSQWVSVSMRHKVSSVSRLACGIE